MRRRSPLTRSAGWLLTLLLLGALLAACGGGGDGDDSNDDATPTSVAATATTDGSDAASPTADAGEGDASPTTAGTTTGGTIGGNAQPTATSGSGEPAATPTERPVSVVTTPKPIATRPALPTVDTGTGTGGSDATETSDDGTILIFEDFEDGVADEFFIGSNEGGTTATVENGGYVVSVAPGFWQAIPLSGTEGTGDGVVWADATLTSTGGSVGLIARQFDRADGGYQFIVCWLDTDGTTGCTLVIDSDFQEMFRQPAGTVPVQEVNTLLLSVVADSLYFEVNGVEVGSFVLADTEPGAFGLFLEAWEEDTTTVVYDNVVVWSAE